MTINNDEGAQKPALLPGIGAETTGLEGLAHLDASSTVLDC